jgi:hypothetical protein
MRIFPLPHCRSSEQKNVEHAKRRKRKEGQNKNDGIGDK